MPGTRSALKTLVLIPTEQEAAHIQAIVQQLRSEGTIVELCGFGPTVAAARTMQAIAAHHPDCVYLLGIAGAYQADTPIGSAFEFDEVACYGVGVGSASSFRSAHQLGWQQWPANAQIGEQLDPNTLPIEDTLPLGRKRNADPKLQLLTCCAAASTAVDVQHRLEAYPHAFAEDMEGFAVAVACHLGKIPLRIFRGISNRVGHRDHSQWKIAVAMHAAADQFLNARDINARDIDVTDG